MPKPLPRVPHVDSPFVLRPELLTLVPLSMATIDRLEARGQFPKRIRLEPTSRVAWLRRELTGYLRHLAKRRQSAPKEDHEADDQEFLARAKRSGLTSEDQPANPSLKLVTELATARADFKAPSQPELSSSATHIGFEPIPGQLFCKCGVQLSRFSSRRHSDDSASVSCRACHAEVAQINFNMER
jgi:predicted DNA-binding transcriptional regulator AlpA